MSRPIPSLPVSSPSSARPLVLAPEVSCTLLCWWCFLHALVGAALLLSNLPALGSAAGLLVLAVHAWLRRPRRPTALVAFPDGSWALPGQAPAGRLYAVRGSCYTAFWIRLVLAGSGTRCSVLLVEDQLDPVTWRSLQAHIRRVRLSAGPGAPAAR